MRRSVPLYLRFLAISAAILSLWFVMLPSPVIPTAYEPPAPPPLTGPYQPNDRLVGARAWAAGAIEGPEDVAVDDEGRLYAGLVDGRIVRVTPAVADGPDTVETFATTGGRPLGLDFAPDGRLIVADGEKGLLAVDTEADTAGEITVLATSADGLPFGFTDDLDIAADGTIYFSDASHRFGPGEYLYDLLEARPSGRLLAWDPASGEVRVLLDDLYFANGIALAPDESFVLVNETYRYRVRRYWLRGPRAGTDEILVDNLPGFPDGISTASSSTEGPGHPAFWVALFTVRNPTVDRLHPHPWAKSLLAKAPKALWPKPQRYGFVLALDADGAPLGSLQDPDGVNVWQATSAEQAGDTLYIGNLDGDRFWSLRLPEELR